MGTQIDLPSGTSSCGVGLQMSFEAQIERMLRPLWGMRVRVSLFSVSIWTLDPEQTLALVQRELAHIGPAGLLQTGGVGLLYIGPRPGGPEGDVRLERRIADVLGRTAFHHTESRPALDIDLVAVHRSLDEIACCYDLLEGLTWRLSHPPAGARLHLRPV